MTDTALAGAPVAAMTTWRTQLPPIPNVCDMPLGPQQACEQLGQAATKAASSALDDFADILLEGFTKVLRIAMTWWTTIPSPQLTGVGGEPGTALSAIRDYSSGLQVLLLTTGIMFAAARLALAKRGGVAGEAQESVLMLARAVFASMAFAAVITAGTRAGDSFANWVLFDASRGDLDGVVDRLTGFDANTRSGLGTGLLLLVCLLGLVSTLIQLVMLVVRQALLILVVAVIPLAAAASGTGPGSQAYKKLLSWSLAFVLFKPVGALVYAIAFTVIGREEQRDPQLVLLGLILLVMSVVVLPALIRLVAPAVATLGGGGGAAAVLAGGGAGVAMAAAGDRSGARKVSEGENAPGGSPNAPPPLGGSPGGGGGGRPMPGGGDSGSSSSGAGSSGTGGGGSAGSASGGSGGARQTGVGAAKPSSASGAGSGGGETAGAAGAGIAGAVVMGAQMAKDMAQQGASAIDNQTRDATAGGLDPDALGPGEVRR
ncbi:hypothetical protein OH799_11910 [Nocardia sp. NBC_00881]|uniref:hypothetical protein n=1 Tax=Nocardia sp. NBC_00881 TaxID=2975995 RepID=UPI00387092A0|nr:hypothetical protein OH799_11910 [Nocardia sp. NBC_00881]